MIILLSFTTNLAHSLIVFSVLSSVFATVYYYLLAYQGMLVSIVYPLMVLSIIFIAHQVWFNLFNQKQVKFIKSAFSSYVASSVADDIIEHHEHLKLGGTSKKLSVFFLDIRDFTHLSKVLATIQLVRMTGTAYMWQKQNNI